MRRGDVLRRPGRIRRARPRCHSRPRPPLPNIIQSYADGAGEPMAHHGRLHCHHRLPHLSSAHSQRTASTNSQAGRRERAPSEQGIARRGVYTIASNTAGSSAATPTDEPGWSRRPKAKGRPRGGLGRTGTRSPSRHDDRHEAAVLAARLQRVVPRSRLPVAPSAAPPSTKKNAASAAVACSTPRKR